MYIRLFGMLAWTGLLAATLALAQKPSGPKVDFATQVLPVLKASCIQCHGPEKQMGGLRLDSRSHVLKGGLNGASVIPGKSAKSPLVKRVIGGDGRPRMPLGFAPLDDSQISALRAWIDAGAPWPDASQVRKHWAYVPPVKAALPPVKMTQWPRNGIDRFVLARLEKEGLRPSPQAPKSVLIRRLYLDLIGLPPTPAEVDRFVADTSPGAYTKVVDELLSRPQFGEKWARAWLDLARYADSNGYEKDGPRSMWPYRDWVIQALNSDMPYDLFTVEQIAGDLLPNATESQRIATGFHRNTMLNEEGGVDQEEARWLTNVDRVGTTGTVWLGSTLACAQCHDHKYDPFSMKDFYRLLAYWENTREPQYELRRTEITERRAALSTEIAEAEKAGQKARVEELKKQLEGVRGPTTLVFENNPGTRAETHFRLKGVYLSKGEKVSAGTPEALPGPKEAAGDRLALARWLVSRENPLTARVHVNRLWEQIFGQGIVATSEDFGTQGARPTHPELLDWLAVVFMDGSEKGAGAPDARPWSQKWLIRLIVTSATYQQSSVVNPVLLAKDPSNRLLARGPRFRLDGETLRDYALHAGGLLSSKMYGPPVMPLQPEGIWDVPYSGEQWVTSPGEDRVRRSVYTYWRRSAPYPMFTNFDATSREFCTVRRSRTNTPLQALNLLNDPALLEAARSIAARMQTAPISTTANRLVYGFRLVLCRRPAPNELARLERLFNTELRHYAGNPAAARQLAGVNDLSAEAAAERAAWTVVANVLLNLDEAVTKE